MVPNSIHRLPAAMDEANVEGEDRSVGSITDGGYAMVEDHAKARGTSKHHTRDWSEDGGRLGLMVFNVPKRVEREKRKRVNHQRLRLSFPGSHVWPFRYRISSMCCGSKPLSRGRTFPCD